MTTTAPRTAKKSGTTLNVARALQASNLPKAKAQAALAVFAAEMTALAQAPVTIRLTDDQVFFLVPTELAALRIAFTFAVTKGIRYDYSAILQSWFVTC